MPNEDPSYRIRVTIEVIDVDGTAVNHKGHIGINPWRTVTVIPGHHSIEPSTAKAQAVWALVSSLQKLLET